MNAKPSSYFRQIALGVLGLILLTGVSLGVLWLLSRFVTGAAGGALAGGVVAVAVAIVSKRFERNQQHESVLAEKKREVYRRMLVPWEQVLVHTKTGKQGDDLLAAVDLAALYSSAFDAVLYGSESVVKKYVEFRTPDPSRDAVDMMRALAALLLAMREDITAKKSSLPVESVLGTFMNFSQEELLLVQLREYVAAHPEAQQKVAEILKPEATSASPKKTG